VILWAVQLFVALAVRDSRRNRRRHHSEQEGAGRQMELHRIDFESNGIGQGRRQRCIVDLRSGTLCPNIYTLPAGIAFALVRLPTCSC
jgi:hypothetical protein